MAALTKAQVLSADDSETREIEVPEWGGTVLISAFTGKARDAMEQRFSDGNVTNIRAYVCSLSIIDPETKELMFSSDEIDELGSKSGKALDRVFAEVQTLNALTNADVEELEGN